VPEMAECDDMRMNSFPIVLILLSLTAIAMSAPSDGNRFIAGNDVIWMRLGTNENDSKRIGNGDLTANVWTEQNGGIVLLIAKTDAWSENGQLLKLGRVRVDLDPNPFTNSASIQPQFSLIYSDFEIGNRGCGTPSREQFRPHLGGRE